MMEAAKASSGLNLVVMIPALNEQETIADVIRAIPAEIPGVRTIRAVVIDDGSTDSTGQRSLAVGARVVRHGARKGVGAAFQTGIAEALALGANLIVSIDADGQFDPQTIPDLVAPVVAGEADFTTASRFADPALTPEMPAMKLWGNRMMSRLISRLIGQRFHDVSCGMRCYNHRAAISLNTIGSFTYTQEVFLNLAFKRLRMLEVPIRVQGQRTHGKSRVAGNLWRYAINTSTIILRAYRDYCPMRFFGKLALAAILPAIALEIFLLVHYLLTGALSPHKWAGFTGAVLFALGLLSLHMGIIGDMLNRHRIYLEEVLYFQRKNNKVKASGQDEP
ncbi:MAG: glycosyltransferase family 2 protein [Phycisphaerae bacterium]|jgi:glycosyltransferase involved in cell wall biosynthesis